MADPLRDSGLDLIREYIPDSPVYTPEDEPSQYNLPYVPSSPVYPTPVYNPPTPEYTPSLITTVPELDLIDMKKEESLHIKFLDPPASPTPEGMPSESPQQQNVHIKFLDPPASPRPSDITSGTSDLQTTPVQYTSPAANTLHPESSGPPQGMPIPVHISRGIPPELKSGTDMDAGLQQADQPIEVDTKEEGECTDQDDQEMSPLEDESMDDETQIKTFPPDPWNDGAFTLQDRLDQVRWESLEPEPNFESYGYNRGDKQRQEMLLEMGRIHRCVDQVKKMLQSISESQENLKDFMIQKATIKLQVNQISRDVQGITQSIDTVSESQDSMKNILKDLYDIINEMNNPNRGDSTDFELMQKINDISNRMTQVNIGQESVKEVMTELKSTLERKPENNKRGYYQTTDCDQPHYEDKVKQPRLSSDLNFAYFDRQYGQILEVPTNREVRRGLREKLLELHEAAQKWEILNYHLKVICTDNTEHISPPVLETDAYLMREEAYLTISTVNKHFRHFGFITKQSPDYNSFHGFISTIFRGLVERKITPAMVFHWLTHQMFWSLCQYDSNKEMDVLTDVILLYRECTPDAKQPYEEDPRLYHHIPELYKRDTSYLNQLEMKCSDIITRYCFCLYHADYPMKFGEPHKYMSFRRYKVLQEENVPVDEEVTQAKLHEGFINSTIMRILHEVHGFVTPYSPETILEEERRAKVYADFSPQEYDCLRNALGLITVNKHLILEKAMKVLQWFKQSTCPCNQHVIGRGGNQWQLRPSTTVPPQVVLQLPTVINSTVLKRRAVKKIATDQASLAVETSSIQSDGTYLQDEPITNDQVSDTLDNTFNQKMKKMFQNPVLQNLFPHEQTLNELCSKILKDVKQANPLKWVIPVNSTSNEVDELSYWKDQMKQDIDCMILHIQTKLYNGLDELYGEMYNLFLEEDEGAV